MVDWLERRDCHRHGFGIYLRHSVVSLGKTLYGTFPCLVVLANSYKFQLHLYEISSGQQYLASAEAGLGNCLLPVGLGKRLRRFLGSQENKYRGKIKYCLCLF